MTDFLLSFDVSGSFSGSTYILTAELCKSEGYIVQPVSVPSALHRLLYKIDPFALASVIPIENDCLQITLFNVDEKKGKIMCEKAISQLKSSLSITVKVTKFVNDSYVLKEAFEALILRVIEESGYFFFYNQSLSLYDPSGIVVSDFLIKSQIPLQSAAQLMKNESIHIKIVVSGKIHHQKMQKFKVENIVNDEKFKENSFLKLDMIPCKVLPKNHEAYAVEISTPNDKEINELKVFWYQLHGIQLNHTTKIIKVIFPHGKTEFSYPSECILEQKSFIDVRYKADNSKEFSKSLKKLISYSLDTVLIDQKSLNSLSHKGSK